ncbi:hypothetical protein J7J83_02125 [bacterium]|nr:hypothetical protein [bacterium]
MKKGKKSIKNNKGLQLKIFSGLAIIVAVFLAYYLYTNITTYIEIKNETASLKNLHGALTTTDKRLDDEVNKTKTENEDLMKAIADEVDYVFPETEKHTLLTRTLESFSNNLNRTKDPFIISNLQYLKPVKSEDESLMILPFTMTIHSSHDNFIKFLEYIENSGTLTDKTRLLNIKSIVINFVAPEGTQKNTSGKDEINFNVAMNSYFKIKS